MNDLETKLPGFPLDPPSHQLDRRMEELFAAVTSGRPAARRSRWWWLALPAVGTIAASFFLMSRPRIAPPQIEPVLYQIEAQGLMRDWLLNPPPESLTAPKMIVSVGQ